MLNLPKEMLETFRYLAKMVEHAAHCDIEDPDAEEEHDGIPDTRGNQLAGTYVMASEHKTVVMAGDGARLARYTSPPLGVKTGHEIHGFIPLYGQTDAEENQNLPKLFCQVLDAYSLVERTEEHHWSDLIEQANVANEKQVEEAGLFTMIVAGVEVQTQHVIDFSKSAPGAMITCQAVKNQNAGTLYNCLKLSSEKLEEIIMPTR